ncbi:MAG: ATP-grasp domain-containing protein [Candidatus Hydrogenedentes bacterium]|nr:ATP-grasp domain-containing protein [Candidatus Hydrogenedentota bacterium]
MLDDDHGRWRREHEGRLVHRHISQMGTVIIVGAPHDPQVARVQDEIRLRGGRSLLIDTDAFPEEATLSMRGAVIDYEGRPLPKDISSVYLRALGANPLAPRYKMDLKHRTHGLLAQMDERLALLASIILTLKKRGVRIVNDLEVNAQHSRKPYQLSLLKEAGLRVPRFAATNDPETVLSFVRSVKRAVYKPVGGGATVRAVNKRDLTRARLESLALAPVLFQERVDGVSLRVYVVGGSCVASAEIHSSELDYRRKEDAVIATVLIKAEQRACIDAARACSMTFSGVDLIRGVNGFYVLECNPSPMFAVFEKKTGLDVAKPLARFLLKR